MRNSWNKNKYYKFHWDHDHNNTEDCFQLKEQISDLNKTGYLRKFVVDHLRRTTSDRAYIDNKPIVGDIQTIHGGFGLGECSTALRKRVAWGVKGRAKEVYNLSSPITEVNLPITFINEDLRGLHLPHDDALVMVNVQRILIDNGNSTDILSLCFQ